MDTGPRKDVPGRVPPTSVLFKYKGIQKRQIAQLLHKAAGLPAPRTAAGRILGWLGLACGITEWESSCGGGVLPVQETLEHSSEAYGGGQMNKSHM